MTAFEAFVLGAVWGGLTRIAEQHEWTVDPMPGEDKDAATAAPLLVLRTRAGVEVLVRVTETRTPPKVAP